MAKIKISKGSPQLDMTPMVDLAFLLVTFFMLTASVRVTEPVVVDTPSSTSDKLLPDNVILVTVDTKGNAFYTIGNPEVRIKTLEKMGLQHNVEFTDKEKKEFGKITSFGVPVSGLKQYLAMEDNDRAKFVSPGIPYKDSLKNELGEWIQFGRIEEQRFGQAQEAKQSAKGSSVKREPLRFAIKADGKTNYIAVKEVIKVFTDKKLYRFNLITNLEQAE